MSDLFTDKLSKKEQVYLFIKSKGRARTSEVIRFSSSIYHNRGDRDCRDLASEGKIWRIADNVKMASEYANSKEEIWSTFEKDREYKQEERQLVIPI